MPNPLRELRSALKTIGECPYCGLTRFVMANSWRVDKILEKLP